jgi:multicomponent Na+:H+ antiporter subunit E
MIFTLLFIFWVILNEKLTTEVIVFGLFLSLFVTISSYKTIRISRQLEKKVVKKLWKIIVYLFILLVEIIKANIDIIKLVLTKDPEITPTLMPIKANLRSIISRVALANSITLTPGTFTVSMNDENLLIHAIRKSNLDGIEESIFVEKLQELEEYN